MTGWMGENDFAPLPVALYGAVLWMSGLAYYILTRTMIDLHGEDSVLARALDNKVKESISLGSYALAIVLSFFSTAFSLALYVLVAVIWLIPDPRIEKTIAEG